MLRAHVFEWHKRFFYDREEIEVDQHPVEVRVQKLQKINEIVRKKRRLSIWMFVDMVNTHKGGEPEKY